MTPQQEIEAALARLERGNVDLNADFSFDEDRLESDAEFARPLAALIRDVMDGGGHWCGTCGCITEHAHDCALLALVRAINRGTP